MELLEVKIMTFGYILGQEMLANKEKLQLLTFVKEASDIQLLTLLKTGKMKEEKEIFTEAKAINWGDVGKTLEKKANEVTNKALQSPQGQKIAKDLGITPQGPSTGEYVAYGALAATAITAGVVAYTRFFSKAAKACKDKSGAEKTSCMRSYKAQAKQTQVGVLTAKLSSCKGNPKCVNKIKARIQKTKDEVKSLRSRA
jgi:hypothetical protein